MPLVGIVPATFHFYIRGKPPPQTYKRFLFFPPLTSTPTVEGVCQWQGHQSHWVSSHHPSIILVQPKCPVSSVPSSSSLTTSGAALPASCTSVFDTRWFGQRHLHSGSVDLGSVHEAERGEGVAARAVVDEGVVGELLDSLHAARLEAGELLTKSFLRRLQHEVSHLKYKRDKWLLRL